MNIGEKHVLEYTVAGPDSAKSLSISAEDNFPEVLATSRMIALMELAAARLMKPLIDGDQLSVGVNVNVNHTAATPVGSTVKVIAVYEGMKGILHNFTVELYDEGGLAGNGTHSRAVINTDRLINGANRRVQKK
jgi:fluoroacetyl-CoA thioesterase